jgi:hypothetical protein
MTKWASPRLFFYLKTDAKPTSEMMQTQSLPQKMDSNKEQLYIMISDLQNYNYCPKQGKRIAI